MTTARNTSVATGTNISKRHTWIALLKTESVSRTLLRRHQRAHPHVPPSIQGCIRHDMAQWAIIRSATRTSKLYRVRSENSAIGVAIAGKTHVKPETLFDFEYIGGFLPKRAEHNRKYRAEGLDTVPVERFLSNHRQENPDQPICLILGDSNPHVTWEPNKIYDPDALPLPPYIADTPIARNALANYYQDITTMDTRISEVDKMLETHGYADNTLFIYTTDHGSEWPHCKWTLYDTGTRLPFIARWCNEISANTVSDAMISHVDFFPTLIDIAGGEPADDLDGKSFKKVLLGKQATFRDKIYGTHTATEI